MKKSLALSFLFIGTVVGAGFSSGREILTFFSGSLALAPLAVISCGIVFFLASNLLLNLASKIDITDISSLCSHFPQKLQTAIETLLVFFFLTICAMMISGADNIFETNSTFGISGIILFALGSVVAMLGNRGLLKVNFLLVPILLCFILFVSIFHLYKSGLPISDGKNLNYVTSIFEGVSYSSMNLLLSAVVLLSAGKGLSKREAFISSAISSVVISVVILLFLLAMNTSSEFLNAEMPIIPMTARISGFVRFVSAFAIWIAIFTTFSSSYFTCFEYFKRFCKPPLLRLAILLAITYPLSRIGFAPLVSIFMPAMGLFGIVILLLLVNVNSKNKQKKSREKYKTEDVIVTPLD
ncbi:MAG: hypothetical protein R3Y18_00385 [Bacillota bacterium]